MIRWDLITPERVAPQLSTKAEVKDMNSSETSDWEQRIAPGAFSLNETVEILRRHAGVYHPVTGTFGQMLANSERIIRTPLRQQVWSQDEIQCGNVVVIGDSVRLMLPSSGQGDIVSIVLFGSSTYREMQVRLLQLKMQRFLQTLSSTI